jgi:hypothetical protein
MAIKNIVPALMPLVNSSFQPVGGGFIYCFTPGGAKTDFVPAYKDSALTIPHKTPIRVSGSGRADVWVSVDCSLRLEDRNGNLIKEVENINPADLGENQGSGLILNGSFETDTDSDGTPDNWSLSSETGSSNAIDSTTQTDGVNSFRFTSVANGGGQLVTSDFFAVNDANDLRVDFDILSTVGTGCRNIVRVEWYDSSQVAISNTDVYDSTTPPTSWTNFGLAATPPVGARFAKIRLIGIDTSTPIAASVYFDRLVIFYPATVSGIFDNITIQNNQIITTNTNGDLELGPNGTGSVNINQATAVDLVDTDNALNVGTDQPDTNPHLALSLNQVQAKATDTTTAALSIQPLGGNVLVGAQSGTGEAQLYGDGDLVLAANGAGLASIHGDSNLDTDVRELQFTHLDGTLRGFIGHPGSDVLEVRNTIHGGNVVLQGEDAGGTLTSLFTGDPDGAATLYHDGNDVAITLADGLAVRAATSPGVGSSQDAQFSLQQADATQIGYLGFNSSANLEIRSLNHGGNVLLSAEDAGGVSRTLLDGDPDAEVKLYNDGNLRFETSQNGVNVLGSTSTGVGTANNSQVRLRDSFSTSLGVIGFQNTLDMRVASHNHGGHVVLIAEDAGGTSQNLVDGNPDGSTDLYYDGSIALLTRDDGVALRGSLNPAIGGTQDSYLLLEDSDGDDIGQVGFISSANLELRSLNHGGAVVLSAEDAGGTLQTLISGDPDTNVQLYDQGNLVVSTLAAADGGLEVDNQLTGAGTERVLTESDALGQQLFKAVKSADESRSTGVLTIDSDLQFSLSSGYYQVIAYLFVSNVSSGTHALGTINFSGIADPAQDLLLLEVGTTITQATLSNITGDTLTEDSVIIYRGLVHLTNTGTLSLNWVGGDGTATLDKGSFLSAIKISDV